MSQKYTQSFKIQSVQKALTRPAEMTLTEMAEQLGVNRSALQRWMTQSKNHLGGCPRIEKPTTEKPFWPDFSFIFVK